MARRWLECGQWPTVTYEKPSALGDVFRDHWEALEPSGMTRISSGSTFFFKRVFPVVWFGFTGVAVVIVIFSGAMEKAPFAILPPVFLAVLGFFITKNLLWDLADEVYDQGDSLLVRKDGQEETIPLSNIINVNQSTMINPPRVTLRLVTPCRWGDEVVFSPIVGIRLNPFARLPTIDDLMVRVDQARRKRGG